MVSNQTTLKARNKVSSIPKLLKYCAAALSVVSFLTTMQGVDDLIVKDALMAGMISFAVQGIILVLGLQFLNVWTTIKKIIPAKAIYITIRVLVIVLYLFSIVFSSFFSFVYITNAAYEKVGITDYNMEIDQFLVNNTNELEKINNADCDELLLSIRTQAPEFNNLLQQNKDNALNEVESIMDGITKYEVATIKEGDKFTVAGASDAYIAANLGNVSSEDLEEIENGCKNFEITINSYVELYEGYYNDYLNLFDALDNQMDLSKAEAEKTKIDNLFSTITETRSKLITATIVAPNSVIAYATQKRDGISNYYTNLLNELKKLHTVYDEIGGSEIVKEGDDSELQSFYESIYSSDIVAVEKIEDAEEKLQNLLQIYLNNLKENEIESNSSKVESLSMCISNLEKFKECVILQNEISAFKLNQLNKVYIIQNDERDSSKRVEETGVESDDEFSYVIVTPEQWKAVRHADVAQFIGLIKQMPSSEENTTLSEMLNTAYELNRNNLESISEMETAINFLRGDQNKVAWISLIIAIFVDIVSLLIGFVLFFYKSDHKVKTSIEENPTDDMG